MEHLGDVHHTLVELASYLLNSAMYMVAMYEARVQI
jgi:hypothetical protein